MRKHQRPHKAAPKKRVRHSTKRAPAKAPDQAGEYRGYDAYSKLYGYETRDDFVDGGLTVPVDAYDIGGNPYLS